MQILRLVSKSTDGCRHATISYVLANLHLFLAQGQGFVSESAFHIHSQLMSRWVDIGKTIDAGNFVNSLIGIGISIQPHFIGLRDLDGKF